QQSHTQTHLSLSLTHTHTNAPLSLSRIHTQTHLSLSHAYTHKPTCLSLSHAYTHTRTSFSLPLPLPFSVSLSLSPSLRLSFSPSLDYLRYGIGPHAHLLYPMPHASIYMQYILLPPPTCFSVPTLLTPVTVTLWAQCIPTKLVLFVSCIYHRMSVYKLCTSTKCKATQPSPHPPFLSPPGRPQADGSPLMCRGSA